jgi:hypothetical protein
MITITSKMELPIELWEEILQKTRSIKTCDKLYDAFPNKTQSKLRVAYESHKERISLKMAITFDDKISFYNGDCLMKEVPFQKNIIVVKFVKNWNTPIGKRDCVVVGTRNGAVMFWDGTTLDYIFMINVHSTLGDIEFHPNESIMLSVCMKMFGCTMKVWKFDENGKEINIARFAVECLGEGKKYYYFHPTEPEIYVFTSHYSYNPYHRKLMKVFFCNYDRTSVSFSERIHSFMYLNEYYTPLKINADASFECIKYDNGRNYFCRFVIAGDEIKEVETQCVCENTDIFSGLYFVVWDFIRVGADIYFYTNRIGDAVIYKQTGDKYKVIYETNKIISQFFYKNGFIVFVEKAELKYIDLETLSVEAFNVGQVPMDFCVM